MQRAPQPHGARFQPHGALQPHGSREQPKSTCYRCGGPHAHHHCKFRSATCFRCNKTGHISKVCRSQPSNPHRTHHRNQHGTNMLVDDVNDSVENFHLFHINNITNRNRPFNIDLHVNERPVTFQLDTGAAMSVITHHDYQRFVGSPISKSSRSLQTYTGEHIPIVGEANVDVAYAGNVHHLPLIVVDGEGPPLLGRNWLSVIRLNWPELFTIQSPASCGKLHNLLHKYNCVFGDNGCLKDHDVTIFMKNGAIPKFCKARQPPFALREGIEEELSRLETAGIIKKVRFSDWATPIVPVRKKDNSIRICGDYKVTVNKFAEDDKHPIPRIEDLMEKLAGGDKFTEIDFSNAYNQLPLDEHSKQLTTINTHKGLYQYQRLCFGISSCPGIFQCIMESLFRDIPNCAVYFDNLFVTGKDDTNHLKTLEQIFQICKDNGLCLRKEKCQFLSDEITFLGYKLNRNGLQPLEDKIRAIKDAPNPENIHQLKAFLGLINYYAKFIHNVSQLLSPLYRLLNKDVKWGWGKEEERSFQKAKTVITSDKILIHFDPLKPIILT